MVARALDSPPQPPIGLADFETWPLPKEPFDAVVSATAFHWIDAAVRMAKAADALRPGGVLAVGCIAGLIDGRYAGRVTKRYLTELRVSRTVPR